MRTAGCMAARLSVLRSPEVVKQLAITGVSGPKGSEEFRALLAAEFGKWPALLPKLGITPQ